MLYRFEGPASKAYDRYHNIKGWKIWSSLILSNKTIMQATCVI